MKPMLASTLTKGFNELKYPLYISEKIDGVRCLLGPNGALTRSGKPIPNNHIRNMLEFAYKNYLSSVFLWLDGELISGTSFGSSQSAVMRIDETPTFTFKVFDCLDETDVKGRSDQATTPFSERHAKLALHFGGMPIKISNGWIEMLPHHLCDTSEQLLERHVRHLKDGGEGSMIRSIDGPYKFGRATEREGYLTKIKQFMDDEATIVGFEPRMENVGGEYKDNFGRTHYSKANGCVNQTENLGSLIVEGSFNGSPVTFRIGTGFDSTLRQQIWDDRSNCIGKVVTYSFMDHGSKDKPRHPVFKGFRDERDMG